MGQEISSGQRDDPALIRTQFASLGEHPVERFAGTDKSLYFSTERIHTSLPRHGFVNEQRRDAGYSVERPLQETGAGGARNPWMCGDRGAFFGLPPGRVWSLWAAG
jgi:hypothetical protein